MVTGGENANDGRLDSTEVLTKGGNAWVFSGVLPSARKGLRSARLNDKILISGK